MSKKLTNCISHRYARIKLKGSHTVYKCQNPGCTHFIVPDLLEGRIAQCFHCAKDFVITKAKALLAKPHCDDCTRVTSFTNKSKKKDLTKLQDLLDDLGI
jgi:hypothetical protein